MLFLPVFNLFSTSHQVSDNKGALYKGTLGAQSKQVCVKEAKFCLTPRRFGTIYTAFFLIIKERANAAELSVQTTGNPMGLS